MFYRNGPGNPVLFLLHPLTEPVEIFRKGLDMSEILGSAGKTSPINPIRKKELDDNWKTVAAKAVTDDTFKKSLAKDPFKVLEAQGLKVDPEIKVNYDETNEEYNMVVAANASEEVQAEAKWWNWRLKIIKEFDQSLDRKVGNVVGFHEGCQPRSII